MSGPTRTILIIAALAVVAVVLLGTMARRYGELASESGTTSTVTDGRSVDADGVAGEGAARSDAELVADAEAFASARDVVREVFAAHPDAAQSMLDEHTGNLEGRDQVKMHIDVMLKLRVDRARALRNAGMSEDEYKAIRERYRAWLEGADVESRWKRVFDGHPELTERMDLGEFEIVDL